MARERELEADMDVAADLMGASIISDACECQKRSEIV